jgi:hypothetical protein
VLYLIVFSFLDPVDEGFKLMKDIRVDKTMVDGKATFKTININKSASQDDKAVVPGGKLLDLGINFVDHCLRSPLFSSPGQRPYELLPSLGVRPSVVRRKLSHLNLY